ncbi:xylulokinase [Archaeoglobus neptunius]|uniref:xylulokinase n=1 Tax=Archaeoglobus neptunius TaxID=2798580 RepID=UPI001E5B1FD6|nr:FGGY-family carbohydrate kinase [Archaeoglobus neptunius]
MMKSGLILGVDVGTTSIKAAVVDTSSFEPVKFESVKAVVEYPKKHWAEKNPETLWNSIAEVCRAVADSSVDAVVFDAHMAGVVPVDENGNALRNIITWLDERAGGLPDDVWKGLIKIQGYSLRKLIKFLRITGGAPSRTGKDPISKIIWIRDNEPDVFNKTHKMLDVRGYLVARATGNFVTSPDEAHLTWLADTRGRRARWSESILKDYNLPLSLFPEIKNSTEIAGYLTPQAASELGLNEGVPVIVGSGDVCATAVGSGAVRDNECHIYIGTSDWVAAHISDRKTDIFHFIGSLLSAIPEKYLLIAEQETAAGAIEWAMKLVGIEGQYDLVEKLVNEAEGGKLLFMPWFYGERAPIDDPYVRGGLINISLDHGRGEVLRAMMEGVAMNIKWVYGYVEKMTGHQKEVSIVGGGALFDAWCQIIASAIKRPVKRIKSPELTGLRGIATMAAVGLGMETFESAAAKFRVDRVFRPNEKEAKTYDRMFEHYKSVYGKLKKIYRSLNSGSED